MTCIIGAGASGIAVCKTLSDHGLPFDCLEMGDRIGGNWVFQNVNKASSAYRSLHINTSRDKMAYSDFRMPDDYPDFPHHTQIADYFETYVDHFGFRDRIMFNTKVEHAARRKDGLWEVRLDNGETRIYDVLCVANGHHWDPRWPEPAFPGQFDGTQIHSHHYIDPSDPVDCVGKRVVVVGMGNSGLDIACELGHKGVAEKLYLSVRQGYYILPKYFGSRVFDYVNPHPAQDPPLWRRLMPDRVFNHFVEKRIEQAVGRPEHYGLPKPGHNFGQSHPAISDEIHVRLGSGDVLPKPNIQELRGDKVRFVDGSEVQADIIIYATGYNITFPFFDEGLISAPGNDIALFQRMIDPRYRNLFFVGLVQPLCALMPIAEEQAKFMAAYLAGRYALPSLRHMETERLAVHNAMKQGYVNTPRHTIQIECGKYTYNLRKELKRGAKRAASNGFALPVPALASQIAHRRTAA